MQIFFPFAIQFVFLVWSFSSVFLVVFGGDEYVPPYLALRCHSLCLVYVLCNSNSSSGPIFQRCPTNTFEPSRVCEEKLCSDVPASGCVWSPWDQDHRAAHANCERSFPVVACLPSQHLGSLGTAVKEALNKLTRRSFAPCLWKLKLQGEYLDIEFAPHFEPKSRYDLERVIDDFILFCVLVGNDFLPCLPFAEIGQHGLEDLFRVYKDHLASACSNSPSPWLTKNCGEVDFKQFPSNSFKQTFLNAVDGKFLIRLNYCIQSQHENLEDWEW